MSITPADCNTRILVFVDTTQAESGSSRGVYMVDNRGPHSQGAGGADLLTPCSLDDFVCWEIRPIDYQTGDSAAIIGFNQSGVWGFDGNPFQYEEPHQRHENDQAVASWIGKVESSGHFPYSFSVNITDFKGFVKTLEITGTSLSVGE